MLPPSVARQLESVTQGNTPTSEQVDTVMQVAKSRLPQGQETKIAQNSGASINAYMDSLKSQGSMQVNSNPTSSTPIPPKIRMQGPTIPTQNVVYPKTPAEFVAPVPLSR